MFKMNTGRCITRFAVVSGILRFHVCFHPIIPGYPGLFLLILNHTHLQLNAFAHSGRLYSLPTGPFGNCSDHNLSLIHVIGEKIKLMFYDGHFNHLRLINVAVNGVLDVIKS